LSPFRRSRYLLALPVVVGIFVSACGDSDGVVGSTAGAGGAKAGAGGGGGKAGATSNGGASAGKGGLGSTAGSGATAGSDVTAGNGATAGNDGSGAGEGGMGGMAGMAGEAPSSGGTTGGTGGATAGTGGAHAGTGGATAGTGGATAGTGGATAGTGGATAGTGGATAGTGGATAGTGGATAGTGGATAGTGGATAGTGGTGGAAPCGGCAVLTAPLSTSATNTVAQIYFAAPTDLTGVTITIRACAVEGDTMSAFQSFLQNAGPGYVGDYNGSLYKDLGSMTKCSVGLQTLTYTVAAETNFSGTFDPAAVSQFSLVVQRFYQSAGPWVDSTVHVDSITFSGGGLGPYTFDANVSALASNSGVAPTWIP